ncbi:MAG: O-methyltransferase [Clostridia bacterium]|nr:O-methyltransferase [Clostridia bacterium]
MNLEVLEEVKQKALEEHIPIIMDDTLGVIEEYLRDLKPKKILEIGTAVGYSASQFVRISGEQVQIDTIELDEERAKVAIENIQKIGIEKNIHVMIGNAVQILPTLEGPYDVIFIDANKGKYPVFLQEALRMSHKGTIIFADNVLYKGYVLSDYNKHKQRTAVRHLREYLAETISNELLDTQVSTIGDGLAISIVK